MERKKNTTIYDLAKRLDVSVTTVSRALNNNPIVGRKTLKRVQELAEELGFKKNRAAANLRQPMSQTIGVILNELDHSCVSLVLKGIIKVATEASYNLVIEQSNDAAKEVISAKYLMNKNVDGLIVSLANDSQSLEHYDPFVKQGVPIVFLDCVKDDAPGIKVVIDNRAVGYKAAMHLFEQGCRRIMHVTGNLSKSMHMERFNGFKQALRDLDLPFSNDLLLVTDLSEFAGVEVARHILEMDLSPDGLFILDDLCAVSCMLTLKQHNVRIPEEIAILGSNNDAVSRVVEPQLSTTSFAASEMGEIAAINLINQLGWSSRWDSRYKIVLPSELIIRGSSKRKNDCNSSSGFMLENERSINEITS